MECAIGGRIVAHRVGMCCPWVHGCVSNWRIQALSGCRPGSLGCDPACLYGN